MRNFYDMETPYVSNDYNGEIHNQIKYLLMHGNSNVILSAPHSVRTLRLDGTMKPPEPYTGSLTEAIAFESGSSAIIARAQDGVGASELAEKDSMYKQLIRLLILNNHVDYFFDIHGLKDRGDGIDIDIQSNNYLNCSKETIATAREILESYGFTTAVDTYFTASGETINSRWVKQEFGIDSMQFEISSRCRYFEDRSTNEKGLNTLTDAFNELINVFKPASSFPEMNKIFLQI